MLNASDGANFSIRYQLANTWPISKLQLQFLLGLIRLSSSFFSLSLSLSLVFFPRCFQETNLHRRQFQCSADWQNSYKKKLTSKFRSGKFESGFNQTEISLNRKTLRDSPGCHQVASDDPVLHGRDRIGRMGQSGFAG